MNDPHLWKSRQGHSTDLRIFLSAIGNCKMVLENIKGLSQDREWENFSKILRVPLRLIKTYPIHHFQPDPSPWTVPLCQETFFSHHCDDVCQKVASD